MRSRYGLARRLHGRFFMKLTFKWLTEFVAFDGSADKLAELLTMAGLEVESIARHERGDDWVLEVSVTPNRGDCLSVMGLAREVAALTGIPFAEKTSKPDGRIVSRLAGVAIQIDDPTLCPRYSAQVVEGVRIGQAPGWMRQRLEACGIRSLNNVVDVTNYVMLETGQPLHAFDLDRLRSGRIVVRQAGSIGKMVTLDGAERELNEGDLLICDGASAIALAGIMGGRESEVTEQTRRILLESAHFDPVAVRRTAKRLGLHSEASHRFERGVDPSGTLAAADRAARLIAEYAGGTAGAEMLDSYPRPRNVAPIELRYGSIKKLLGCEIPLARVERLLIALGMEITENGRDGVLMAVPPTSRADLTREADLIEELARVYGYQNIPTTLPALRSAAARVDPQLLWERRVRSLLAGQGLVEVINLPFTGAAVNREFRGLWQADSAGIGVVNPLVKESDEMRLSLLPGLIENLRFNLSHKAESVFLYHLGKTFAVRGGEIQEKQCLAGVLYGPRPRRGLRSSEAEPVSYLDCKGVVEGILEVFYLPEPVVWSRSNLAPLHPGRAADVLCGGQNLGYAGESHPLLNDQFGVPAFMAFELDIEKLVQYSPRQIKVTSLPRYPAVERDFAMVVDQALPSQHIIDRIDELGQTLIQRVEVFDEYRGASIPEGKKSLAYKILYRAEDRTLTDSEVNALHQRLVDHVGKVFDAQRRS